MKLKDDFILRTVGGQYLMVATGGAAAEFNGLVRNNKTANFILEQLRSDTTEDAVVSAVLDRYAVPAATARADVHQILEQLRDMNALDE